MGGWNLVQDLQPAVWALWEDSQPLWKQYEVSASQFWIMLQKLLLAKPSYWNTHLYASLCRQKWEQGRAVETSYVYTRAWEHSHTEHHTDTCRCPWAGCRWCQCCAGVLLPATARTSGDLGVHVNPYSWETQMWMVHWYGAENSMEEQLVVTSGYQ